MLENSSRFTSSPYFVNLHENIIEHIYHDEINLHYLDEISYKAEFERRDNALWQWYDGKYGAYSIDLRVIINYHYLVVWHARSTARFA